MLRLKNSLLVFVTSMSIVFSPVLCHSETADSVSVNLVTNLEKEQRAPFKGILLSEEAAAKLFADIKFSRKELYFCLRIESWSTMNKKIHKFP